MMVSENRENCRMIIFGEGGSCFGQGDRGGSDMGAYRSTRDCGSDCPGREGVSPDSRVTAWGAEIPVDQGSG